MSVCIVALLGSWMYICRTLRKISNFVIAKLAENFGISNLDQASCQNTSLNLQRLQRHINCIQRRNQAV